MPVDVHVHMYYTSIVPKKQKMQKMDFMDLLALANDMAQEVGMEVRNFRDLRNLAVYLCGENLTEDDLKEATPLKMAEWLGII